MDYLELLKDVLQSILFAVITGCGIVIVKKVMSFLNGKIDEVQAKTKLAKYENLNKLIDKAQTTVTDIVCEINETFTKSLKNSGEFTKETATIAKDKAIETAMELINKESAIAVEEVYGSFDKWLEIAIEKAVVELKK